MDLGDLIFRSVLDEHDEHADPQLFKVDSFSLLMNDRSDESIPFLFKENLRDQRFYTKYKLEIPDLRLIYFLSGNLHLFSSYHHTFFFFVFDQIEKDYLFYVLLR